MNFLDQIAAPMILFQGLEDKIVPPNQALMMVEACQGQGATGRLSAVRGRATRLSPGQEYQACA